MSNWSIGRKIALGLLLVLLQALSVGMFGLWMNRQTAHKLDAVSAEYLPETGLATQVERELLNARIHFIYFVTIQKEGSLEKGWARFRNAEQALPKLRESVSRSEMFAGIRPDVEQLCRDFSSYRPVLERIIDVVQKGQNHGPEFADLLMEWARLGGAMVDSAGRLSHHGSRATEDSAKDVVGRLNNGAGIMAGLCAAGLLIGLALVSLVTRNITRSLGKVTLDLEESARQVAAAASQVSGSAQSLAQGASEQAASLEETSASSEQINAMASQNRERSLAAADNMVEVSDHVGGANRNLEQMLASMDGISSSSDKISRIIKVIDEIAFQTNILALNAAVEAARAGEAGLGFAVVADEVRTLSQRCAQAAQDTEELIQESVASSSDGRAKMGQVATAVRSITESSVKVMALVEEVKQGSEEQARGIEQVANAIAQMEKLTQTTAANAEESASASEELRAQSETLQSIVARLDGMVHGGRRAVDA
ncbi:MAG TPA: methyl-accepting chemotaxis protein [Bryobacteraceae bacterium]|nr:methyl-accepting chemotaxis protein [Bryobacteraceae bacterium]